MPAGLASGKGSFLLTDNHLLTLCSNGLSSVQAKRERGRELWSPPLVIRIPVLSDWGPCAMISFNRNYLFKSLSPNIVVLTFNTWILGDITNSILCDYLYTQTLPCCFPAAFSGDLMSKAPLRWFTLSPSFCLPLVHRRYLHLKSSRGNETSPRLGHLHCCLMMLQLASRPFKFLVSEPNTQDCFLKGSSEALCRTPWCLYL